MSKRKYRGRLASQRDHDLLFFLWKWKVATSAFLIQRFFPNVSGYTAYRRLWALEKGGFIECVVDKGGNKFLWQLTKRGFDIVKGEFEIELKEDGYKSESMGHDLLVMAFQVGDWAIDPPQGVSAFSEQQLRRFDEDHYPAYVPRMSFHRADGYSLVPTANGTKTIAFEVELHVKNKRSYGNVSYAYRHSKIDTVLWLVPKRGYIERIQRNLMAESSDAASLRMHGFVELANFMAQGWGAQISGSHVSGKTVREIMCPLLQNSSETASKPVCTRASLNLSKAPHKSKTYKTYAFGNFAN